MPVEIPYRLAELLKPKVIKVVRERGNPEGIEEALLLIAQDLDDLWKTHFGQEDEIRLLNEEFFEHGHKGVSRKEGKDE